MTNIKNEKENAETRNEKNNKKERGNVILAVVCSLAILLFAAYRFGIYDRFFGNVSANSDTTETTESTETVVDDAKLAEDDKLQEIIKTAQNHLDSVKTSQNIDEASAADTEILSLMDEVKNGSDNYTKSVYNYLSCVDAYVVNTYNTKYDAEKYSAAAETSLNHAEQNYESMNSIRGKYLKEAGLSENEIADRLSK